MPEGEERNMYANKIIDQFIRVGSRDSINISWVVREAIIKGAEKANIDRDEKANVDGVEKLIIDKNIFEDARSNVSIMLIDSGRRFRTLRHNVQINNSKKTVK